MSLDKIQVASIGGKPVTLSDVFRTMRASGSLEAVRQGLADTIAHHKALELGLDDESEAYNEAGMLLDELTGGTAFSSTSTTPTASPHHRSSSSNNRYPRGFGTPRSSKLTPKFSFETVHEHFPATFGGGIAESGNDDDDHDGSDDDGDKAEDIAYDEAVREVEEV